jgi:sec-independent protein translocase protein TatB
MFDIGMSELLLIGFVALIVVGPKDLPGMFRTLGQFTAKARRMAREFSSAMEAAADEAGVGDVKKTIEAAANPGKMGLDAVKKAADFDLKPGSETAKLSAERQEARDKIAAKAAEVAEKRIAKEAAEKAAPTKAPKKAAAKKPTAKKPAAKKAAPKAGAPKTAAKKPAAKKPKTPKADT